MIRIKEGVRALGLAPETLLAIAVAEGVYATAGAERVVTSLTDGPHSDMSLHHCGRAVDVRTNHIDRGVANRLAQQIRERLGRDFGVVLERDHLHIEFDPKK